MGADLTIDHPSFRLASKAHHDEFLRLVEARNAIEMPDYLRGGIGAYLGGYATYASLATEHKAWLRSDAGKAYKAADKAVDKNMGTQPGYFRDSYNYSSVMWAMGLSWWAVADADAERTFISDEGMIQLADLPAFIAMVKAAPILPMVQGLPAEKHSRQDWVNGLSAKELKSWNTYFVGKKRKLLAFLRQAQKLGAGISASV